MKTMVVNLADIFESYVRQVIKENLNAVLPGAVLRDGNRHQVALFMQGGQNTVKPDIYLESSGKSPVVLDAKYKPALRAADRYEVLAFCEALQSKLAIFVSPSERGKQDTKFIGRTPGGIELHSVRIDLGSRDIRDEEGRFISRLRSVIEG